MLAESRCRDAFWRPRTRSISLTEHTTSLSMPPVTPLRLLSRVLECPRSPRPSLAQYQWRRCASTKHPKGFEPPSREDLDELRERTQEFASRCTLRQQKTVNRELLLSGCVLCFCTNANELQDERSLRKLLRRQTTRMSFPTTCGGN